MTHRRCFATAAFLAALISACAGVGAIYSRPDLENVPVARLVGNLERELAANPKDADIHVRLARLYAMAYAANTEELPVTVLAGADKQPRQEVWFGHEPNIIPRDAPPGMTRTAAARAYLQKSLEHYRTAVDLNGGSLLARIGHAWALEQTGQKATAIKEYRQVIAQAWPKEQGSRFAQLGQRFYTEEASQYLIALLDPKRDASEIAELRGRMERLQRIPRPITPIAIPLADGTSLETIVDLDAAVLFDADGTGFRRSWTWIRPQAGWLVYDPTARGRITSALQWFGDATFFGFWANGYEALRALDDDGNGELLGAELRHLAIWHDADRDGVSTPGEVRPVGEHGIAALSCRFTAGDGIFAAARSETGLRLRDGRTRPTYDVILRRSATLSSPAPE